MATAASRVLLFGATGRVGRLAVPALVDRGLRVRALVRDGAKAAQLLGTEAELVEGDLLSGELPPGLMRDVDVIVFTAGGAGAVGSNPRAVDYESVIEIAAQALAAGVKHMILVSSAAVTQVEHPHNCSFHSVLKWKWRGEQALRASGLAFTIVRALGLRDRPGGEQGIRIVQGDRIAFGEDVARADVAALLADMAGVCAAEAETPVAARLSPLSCDRLSLKGLMNQTFEIYNDATAPVVLRTPAFSADPAS